MDDSQQTMGRSALNATVVLAEKDPFNLRLLQEVCETAGYRVVTAADGTEVLNAVARETPDLVLLDAHLSAPDGFEVLRILKSDDELRAIPIILVTNDGDIEARSRGIVLGADDYVTQPYRVFEIEQRLRNALNLGRARKSLPPGVVDADAQAGNLAQLHISLEYEYTRAQRYQRALSYLVVRVENLGELIDRRGSAGADHVLRHVSAGLRECIRNVDQLFHARPDEFSVILPETSVAGAEVVLDRVRADAKSGALLLWGEDSPPEIGVVMATSTFEKDECGASLRQRCADLLEAH